MNDVIRPNRLHAGIFLAPFHPVDEDPTLALRRDIELIEHLDRVGFDEAWIGEHHSAGYEIIASPELMIAAAAERTQRIRLGTGVISLPYHHPLTVANRIVQLDHMTRGRAMFGVGPGLLPSDAEMLGIPVSKQRDRMAESLDVILRLVAGEIVTEQTEWYTLKEARCQLLPYTRPRPEFAVASTFTPSGGKLAGRYNVGMLCVAASQQAGYDVLGTNWQIATEVAREHGREMDRSVLRLVAPMHIAETREQAMRDVKFGLTKWIDYFSAINPTATGDDLGAKDPAEAMVESGRAVIGTPDDAAEMIEKLEKQSGGFGCILMLAHNWANFEATKKSYEMFARHVLPRFNGSNVARDASLTWTRAHGAELMGKALKAASETVQKHFAEQAAKQKH
ncbi:MAG TPA: LLM class flavin-dependent oxidoreductase [Candidatus Binataceae bacterium]|nr:LLM class flavin-dependent oxidoreductase [Candidatus Binataceae bacterium]